MSLVYRREIDGLRAIAVGAVVLYHAGLAPAAGYVGVDVFFVISGYLITALLLREQDQAGRIDLWGFYARRVRRIFPASAVVIAAVLAAAFVLVPHAAGAVAQSAAAAAAFVANLYFQAQTGGYWGQDASQMPLLHLWSLAVEEQFYLVWPALLMLVPRARLQMALVVLFVASFALAEWWLQARPEAAFYQMPARAWELGAGALVATLPVRALPRWCTWAGLVVTVGACFVVLPHFPGVGALPAVAGTALLLAAIHGGASNALLASRPMVGLGLISYSLYLWHWPLLALDRLVRVGESPLPVRLALVAIAVVLAIASYRYVETPFRRWRAPTRATVGAGATIMLALSCAAWASRPAPPAPAVVFVPTCEGTLQKPSCLGTEPKVVIWGDSFAHAWLPMAQVLAERAHQPLAPLARAGCPPLLVPLTLRTPQEGVDCAQWNRDAVEYLRTHRADTLVLAARWQLYSQDVTALSKAVATVAPYARRVLVIGPTPTLPDAPSKCRALGSDCAIERAKFEAEVERARQALALVRGDNVQVLEPADWLCDAARCPGIRGGAELYTDTIHVSMDAARTWAGEIN